MLSTTVVLHGEIHGKPVRQPTLQIAFPLEKTADVNPAVAQKIKEQLKGQK